MNSIHKLPVAFASQNTMVFYILGIMACRALYIRTLAISDLILYHSSSFQPLPSIPAGLLFLQHVRPGTLPPQGLHICFCLLEHSSQYQRALLSHFVEVLAQMSPLQRISTDHLICDNTGTLTLPPCT